MPVITGIFRRITQAPSGQDRYDLARMCAETLAGRRDYSAVVSAAPMNSMPLGALDAFGIRLMRRMRQGAGSAIPLPQAAG